MLSRLLITQALGLALWFGGSLTELRAAVSPEATNYWSFRPLKESTPPRSSDSEGIRNPVDLFIRAGLDKAALRPSPPASKSVLIRRASLDLLGLPPTPAEVEAFLSDTRTDAFERLVDRLLASPHYGERWGRWWLDLARYADSNGQDENKVMANAWRYRDWVIQAMNRDLPFDQFLTWQLAGDLLPSDGVAETEVADRLTATGFLVLGPKMLAEQDKLKLTMDLIDEQIDTVSRTFLGLTVGCARCHDHKFDPIPTRDYYALAGIFKSTTSMADLAFVSKWNERSISGTEEKAQWVAFQQRTNQLARELSDAVKGGVAGARDGMKEKAPAYASAVVDWLGRSESERTAKELTTFASSRQLEPGLLKKWVERLQAWGTNRWTNQWPLETVLRELPSRLRSAEAWRATEAPSIRVGPGGRGAGEWFHQNGAIQMASAPELEPEALTLASWVRIEEYPQDDDPRRWLVGKNANEWAEGHYALIAQGSRLGAYLNIGGAASNLVSILSSDGALPLHQWVHTAMTYDGTTLKFFVNGVSQGERTVSKARVAGDGSFCLAKRSDGYRFFQGGLDEVSLFSRALSAEEIRVLAAAAGRTPPDVAKNTEGLVKQWSFEPASAPEREEWLNGELALLFFGSDGLLEPTKDSREGWKREHRHLVERLERARDQAIKEAPQSERFAMAVTDASAIDLPVHLRGSHLNLAKEKVPRGFLQVVHSKSTQQAIPEAASGRLQLASWLTSRENPLTSRVVVNRLWQAHFGEGLVRSSDNFGLRGDAPSHPELLDWLALRFQREGWSFKQLHRLLLSSATYQQASAPGLSAASPGGVSDATSRAFAKALEQDPENRWLGRFPRQRLEAEMVRDGLLAVSGRLDPTMGGTLVSWNNNDYVPADETVLQTSTRRSIYLPIVRDRVYDVLTVFDFANPSVSTAKRIPTVVSHQALFFMNSPLMKESAKALAESILHGSAKGEDQQIEQLFLRLFCRRPESAEAMRAQRFLQSLTPAPSEPNALGAWTALCQTLLASNEFVYRD